MNTSYTHIKSHKKIKASGYRKLAKTSSGRKIIKMRRKKRRKIL